MEWHNALETYGKEKAEEAAGGDLDGFKEIKPGWYENDAQTIKIE